MSYAPTKYGDLDLTIKAERVEGVRNDPVVRYFQQAYIDLGGPAVKGRTGGAKPLTVDGAFGPQTTNAVLAFQEAAKVPRSGKLDGHTYYQLDWRVFGLDGRSWKAAPLSYTSAGDRGKAIIKGHNKYLRPPVPVNTLGLCREAQRASDALEAQVHKPLGWEGAVDRNAAGSSRLSRHALSVAGDDMGDQDKDRIVEPSEILARKAAWDFFIVSCTYMPAVTMTMQQELDGKTTTVNFTHRGHFRLVTQCLGNLAVNGNYIFPANSKRRDVTWSAARNTPKSSSLTVHVSPFHHHYDVAPGAPFGSPW